MSKDGDQALAVFLVEEYGFGLEWGVKLLDAFDGWIYQPYLSKAVAERVVIHRNNENPELQARLVVRIVGKWEER